MKTVAVSYFAIFRDQAGCDQEQVETGARSVAVIGCAGRFPGARSVAALFAERQAVHGGLVDYPAMKFAINDRLVAGDAEPADGDRVLFFPPVAGG